MHQIIRFSFILYTLVSFVGIGFCQGYKSEIDRYIYPEEGKKISLDFRNANLNDVLKIFSQQSGMNFIASSEISQRTVNIYLDNVTVEDALEKILKANGLTYEVTPESNIFLVKPLVKPEIDLITRVYQLNHATLPSSKLNNTLSEFENSEEAEDEDTGGEDGVGILQAIKSLLSSNGSIIEDIRTNSLIVTDIASQFPRIEQTLKRLDVRIPQILIESELLDISKNTSDQLGVSWGSTPLTFSGGERADIFPFDFDNIESDNFNSFSEGSRDFSGIFGDEGRYTVGTTSFAGLQFMLQFLRTKSDTKNLARPRILTLNNETAEIRISTNEAIGIASVQSSTDGGSSTASVEAERVQTGVFLTVTPQVNLASQEITMAIEPKVIQASTGATFTIDSTPITFKDPETRGTKSILRVKDGDTIIIGGLLRTTSVNVKTKVPVLNKVPLLGAAFRHKDNTDNERELIVFITPHILKENFSPASSMSQANFAREQPLPRSRLLEVESALSNIEKNRY